MSRWSRPLHLLRPAFMDDLQIVSDVCASMHTDVSALFNST